MLKKVPKNHQKVGKSGEKCRKMGVFYQKVHNLQSKLIKHLKIRVNTHVMSRVDQFLLENAYASIYGDKSTEGLPGFLYHLTDKYPNLNEELVSKIKEFINNSGCPKIEIKPTKYGLGVCLSNVVIINPSVLNFSLEQCLYTIFHEIAHQYQYKKYKDKIENLFIVGGENEVKEDEAAIQLKKIELVADKLAIAKCNELVKLGLDPSKIRKTGFYTNYTHQQFLDYLNQFRGVLKRKGIKDTKKVAEYFYNYIVNGIN
jgi:hypothetical protein